MPDILPPRNVIYFSSNANQIPLAGIGSLPYTDVIIAFVMPNDDLSLTESGGAFNEHLQGNIEALQDAGKNVLISFGGADAQSSAYQACAQDVAGLVERLVSFVTNYGFDGVDIDFEDDAGFTGTYDGVGFLIALTNGLAAALPPGQDIITHAPQPPYWDFAYHGAPYAGIWENAGSQITWINSQFYNNPRYDATPGLKVGWYNNIAAVTGAQKLMLGALTGPAGSDEGYLALDQILSEVIAPLQDAWGAELGGVMGWEFARDQGGAWAQGIWQELTGPDGTGV